MKLKEYQDFCSQGILPATLEREPIIGFALGLAGESGEVVDDIKKKYFHGRDIDSNHTIEELGDVMWYVANIATQLGVSLEDILQFNIDKLNKRYPEMYNAKTNATTICMEQPCKGCGYNIFDITKSGPHNKAICVHCGKFYKFISKEELQKYEKHSNTELPWD